MNLISKTIVFVLVGAATAGASPLIFKARKTVTSDAQTVIGSFDASKYRSIRIAVKAEDRTEIPIADKAAGKRLMIAEANERIIENKINDGLAAPLDMYKAKAEIQAAEEEARRRTDLLFPPIGLYAVDGTDEILIHGLSFLPGGEQLPGDR